MPAPPDSFAQHMLDRLQPLGEVTYRRMFGGACLFVDGSAFAILDSGVIYFKVDDDARATFTAAGARAFTYFHKGKNEVVDMGYMTVPDDDVDGPGLLRWAKLGADVARRKAASKKKPTRTKKNPRARR